MQHNRFLLFVAHSLIALLASEIPAITQPVTTSQLTAFKSALAQHDTEPESRLSIEKILPNDTILQEVVEYEPKTGEPFFWLFGFGSLIFNPGVSYSDKQLATACGYARRFWHANMYHRGTKNLPGRMVTILKRSNSSVPGVLMKISGYKNIVNAFKHLYRREIDHGYIYATINVEVEDKQNTTQQQPSPTKLRALTFMAGPGQKAYISPQDDVSTANSIANAVGAAGPNWEYLFKLTDSLRRLYPTRPDNYLNKLENMVKYILAKKGTNPTKQKKSSAEPEDEGISVY